MLTDSPCYRNGADCPRRCADPNCHGTCKEYIEWRAAMDSRPRRPQGEVDADGVLSEKKLHWRNYSNEKSQERRKK